MTGDGAGRDGLGDREVERAIAEAARRHIGAPDDRLVTADVAALTPYAPTRPWRQLASELGIAGEELLMLHANENVLGPSARAVEAARFALAESNLYPDGGYHHLRDALAARHGVTPDRIAVGNGSNEIIELLVRTFVGPGETVATAWPSFVVYRLITQASGRELLLAPLRDDRYDLASLATVVDRRTKLVFISNPNNPTGTYVSRRAIAAFLDRIPRSVIVVLDEAYAEYVTAPDYPDGVKEFSARPRTVVLRTFSKIYGLAGLRVGYGVMDRELVQYIDCVRQPYNVSAIAQAAAVAALGDTEHVARSQALARDGREELARGLGALGLEVVPSQANFVLVRFGGAGRAGATHPTGAEVAATLKGQGILVRDMRGYEMPDTVRVTVGTSAMNQRVISAIASLYEGR